MLNSNICSVCKMKITNQSKSLEELKNIRNKQSLSMKNTLANIDSKKKKGVE